MNTPTLPYSGAIAPREAWRMHIDEGAVIVDVRTKPEWEFVGAYPGAAFIEWRSYGASGPNPHFLAELRSRFSPETTLLFLCRSGGRSHQAATLAAAAGYPHAFNILEGFEGEKGPDGRRGHQGWRAAGLPWQQG